MCRRIFNVLTYGFRCRQQSLRSDERRPESTLEQSQSGVPPGDLSHQGPDGVLRQGASEAAPRFRRLSRPFAKEERVSVRLFKVGFLERRWQDETGPAGAVFGKGIDGRGNRLQAIFLDSPFACGSFILYLLVRSSGRLSLSTIVLRSASSRFTRATYASTAAIHFVSPWERH